MSNSNAPHITAQTDERLAIYGARLNSVENAVVNLGAKFDAFVSSFNDRSRTPWALLISMVMASMVIVTTVGGLAYAPVIANLNRLETSIKDVQSSSVSVAAFMDFRNTYESNRQISRAEYIDKFNAMKSDYSKDIDGLQRQLDEVKSQFGGVYSLKDQVARSEKIADELQSKMNELILRQAKGNMP